MASTPRLKQSAAASHPRNRNGGHLDVVFYLPWLSAMFANGSAPPGGAETQIHLLARALVDRGWKVGAIVFPAEGLPDEVDGIRLLVRPRPMQHVRLIGKLGEVFAIWSAVLRARSPVFVQRAAGFETGLVGLAAKAKRGRFFYSSANVVDFDFGRLERRRRNVAMFELGLRLADSVIVQTPEQERLCEDKYGHQAVMIPSIAEPAAPRTAAPESFLWIGRLRHYKQPILFAELAAALPGVRFEMVTVPTGEEAPELKRELEARARSLPNLILHPAMSRDQVGAKMESAVAVVNTAEYEGMPNIFLEAWSRGVPALSYSHDPDGVIGREGLGEFAAGAFDRFVALADQMWKARGSQDAVGRRCRDYIAARHSPEAVAELWASTLRLPSQPGAPR
jgi:glycosyltransferase involved in cell wall biosynthesis